MVKVTDLILGIRARLGDTDITRQTYSDMEIIDAINSSLSHISEDLLCFSKTWTIPTIAGVNRYVLPMDFLRFISIRFNTTLIKNIISIEQQAKQEYPTTTLTASFDNQTLFIYGTEIKANDEIELYYNYFETISNKDEILIIPNNTKEVLVYYALSVLYENPVKKNGLSYSNRYRKLYDTEIIKLSSRLSKNRQSKNITTSYIKV